MRTLARSLLALAVLAACDSDKKPKEDPNAAAAKKAEDDAADAKKLEERRKKRETEDAAKLAAEAERKQQIDALCIVPKQAKKPKKLDKACEELAQAQMDFFARQYAAEPETLEKMKQTAPLQKANMLKMCTSIDVAVGLKHAFDTAPMGFVSSTNDLISTCIVKLGQPQGGDTAVPGKPN